jgi:hypothetical protein
VAAPNQWGNGPASDKEKIQWVIDHPDFRFKPATMAEFLGPGYMDLDPLLNKNVDPRVKIRPGVKQGLIDIFGDEIDPKRIARVRRSMMTGGIGIGKTTFASIALAYMVHWVSCLRDPQSYFGLFPGSRIAFMLMSTKGTQTSEVLFSDIKARIASSPWFEKYAPYNADDTKRKNQLRFAKDIWIIPGNSSEKSFEGYNILGGILDEGDSHTITDTKDYAEVGWETIENRISSRFTDLISGDHLGLIIAIGQMKKADGFMARKKKEMLEDIEKAKRAGEPPKSHVVQMAIWESHGWESYRDPKTGKIAVFYYDINRRQIVPPGPAAQLNSPNIIKIPQAYQHLFEKDPVKALKDQAGIPPQVEDPFIVMTDRVDAAMDRYEEHHPDLLKPVTSNPFRPEFHELLVPTSPMKRVLHVDIGYAAHGDAGAMAMGYIKEVVDVDGEWKPYIVFDMLLRIMPRGGEDLMLREFRDRIVQLRNERGFKISVVSYDGFQSVESQQILRKQYKFNVAEVSVDRSKGPYEDLREAINEQRIEFPRYTTLLKKDDTEKTCVIRKELLELTDVGRKIDHPPRGSKDIADAMAGVVTTLMGNNTYRRGAKKAARMGSDDELSTTPVSTSRTISPMTLRRDGGLLEDLLNPWDNTAPRAPRGLPPVEVDPFGGLGTPRMR